MSRAALRATVLAAAAWGCRTGEVPARERPPVLTIQDFAMYDLDLKDARARESLKRTTLFDGTFSIDYEYTNGDSTLQLSVTIDVEETVRDARVLAASTKAGLTLGFRSGGLTVRQDSAAPYGDESYFATVRRDTTRVGHVMFVRRGTVVYTVVLTGLVFPSPDEWRFLLDPKLAHLDSLKLGRS